MALALISTLTVSLTVLLAAAPAGAFISGEFGLQQRKPVFVRSGPLQYHGGPVIHASDSYAIYWDPDELYNSEWMRLVDKYFQNVGAVSGGLGDVFALNSQYGETGYSNNPTAPASAKEAHASNQSTFRGAYTDTDPYPSSGGCTESAQIACVTDQEIKTELQKVIKSGVLPGATGTVPGAQSTPVYYLLTPPGVTVCAAPKGPGTETPSTCSNSTQLEVEAQEIKKGEITHHAETGICGYHSTIEPHGATPIVYAVQPWVAGYAGLFYEAIKGPTADVLACQDDTGPLEEPNQLTGQNPFAYFGAGLADVIVGDLANEQANIVVNPLLSGWYQNASTAEGGSPEQGDMCQFNFGPPPETPPVPNPQTHAATRSDEEIGSDSYYLHWAFNSSDYLTGKNIPSCWQGVDLEPHITAPNPVNVGDVVGLDANESGITLDAAPLDLRRQKEEARVSEEVLRLGDEETILGDKITELGEEETKLTGKISEVAAGEKELEKELPQLTEEGERVAAGEVKLRNERKVAKEKGELTKAKEEEFAATEKRLAEEHKLISEKEAAVEASTKSDKERRIALEKEDRTDHESKLLDEEDKKIVKEDIPLAKAEEKLAKEDKLIKEREPLAAPIYKWDFGYQENGKEVTEEGEEKASVFHTFPCAKTYKVELTVVDGGGNEQGLPESKGTKEITVVGGKPCEEAPSGGSSTGSPAGTTAAGATSSTAAGSSAPTNTTTTTPPLPGPVASAAAVSRSLSSVLKKGLVISYSVNEQVAGQFQVLLAASIAKRIGLHGAPATDLPVGSVPSIVIGKAILVTTKGGRGSLKIQFGKKTAAKLRKLRSVTLTIRLVVRNASSHSPLTTTVISTVTLSR